MSLIMAKSPGQTIAGAHLLVPRQILWKQKRKTMCHLKKEYLSKWLQEYSDDEE